jgi:hypothetical protein
MGLSRHQCEWRVNERSLRAKRPDRHTLVWNPTERRSRLGAASCEAGPIGHESPSGLQTPFSCIAACTTRRLAGSAKSLSVDSAGVSVSMFRQCRGLYPFPVAFKQWMAARNSGQTTTKPLTLLTACPLVTDSDLRVLTVFGAPKRYESPRHGATE